MTFQMIFYSVMGNYFFLGGLDHLLSKDGVVSATNKDSIKISRCSALYEVIRFNSGSYCIAIFIILLCYATVIEPGGWNVTVVPENLLGALLFAGPAAFMALMAFIVPIILNPFVLGWPFHPSIFGSWCASKPPKSKAEVVDLDTFLATEDVTSALDAAMERVQRKPDVEIGSLATREMASPEQSSRKVQQSYNNAAHHFQQSKNRPDASRKSTTTNGVHGSNHSSKHGGSGGRARASDLNRVAI